MSTDDEKKFVIKHTFKDVKNMQNSKCYYGQKIRRFNIPWRMYIYSKDLPSSTGMLFECLKMKGDNEWEIDTTILAKVITKDGEKVFENKRSFKQEQRITFEYLDDLKPLDEYLVDGNLPIEYHVTINAMTGINKQIMRNFANQSAKETSDVVLKVKDRKFYVSKMYLSAQSTYFKSLFLGKFEESKQSEVELKDIDTYDFQKFLEVLYVNPDVNDDTVEGILELSDMYDAKVVLQQCEKFLDEDSKRNLKEKFILAAQYKLENLKKKCMPELKTFEDIASVIPEDSRQFDTEVWKELLNLALYLNKD